MIHVHLHFAHHAEVTIPATQPSLWQRVFLRATSSPELHRFAVLGACGLWHWDDTGKLVTDAHVLEALHMAIVAHRALTPIREALAAKHRGVPPPLN